MKQILVIEDDRDIQANLKELLEDEGYAVTCMFNGQEALDRLISTPTNKVDLVITDLNMPVMDGMTLIRQLRAKPSMRFTPILMLTTESSDTRKAEGKAAGATGWIIKPFQSEQLLRVIEKVLPT